MIVKTGANYQAEGGYIEASREGNEVTITTDGAPVVVPSINGIVVDSIEAALMSRDPSFNGTISCSGLYIADSGIFVTGFTVTTPVTRGLGYKIGTAVAIQGGTPELKEGSKNCVLKRDSSSGSYILLATGSDPVAILGVE